MSKLGVELSHKQLEVLRYIDQRGSASKILDTLETGKGNVEIDTPWFLRSFTNLSHVLQIYVRDDASALINGYTPSFDDADAEINRQEVESVRVSNED